MDVISGEKQRNVTPMVGVRIRPELRAAAEAVATEGATLSDVIRTALTEYVTARGQQVA